MCNLETIPKIAGIYKLTNLVNGKIYIGKSVNLYVRTLQHRQEASRPARRSYPISKAIQKYGWDNFELVILETCPNLSKQDILLREAVWIEKYHSTDKEKGYNIAHHSNDCSGIVRSIETRILMSQIAKERCKKYHPWTGRRHSLETKTKMSQSAKERLKNGVSDITRNKISFASRLQNRENFKKQIKQIDRQTGQIIKIWNGIVDATISFGRPKNRSSAIWAACNNYVSPSNKQSSRKTAFGFYWDYV